jgi:hypothetical protein
VVSNALANDGLIMPVKDGELVPHALEAVTETDPSPDPMVILAATVP